MFWSRQTNEINYCDFNFDTGKLILIQKMNFPIFVKFWSNGSIRIERKTQVIEILSNDIIVNENQCEFYFHNCIDYLGLFEINKKSISFTN